MKDEKKKKEIIRRNHGFWSKKLTAHGWTTDDVERVRSGNVIKIIKERFGVSENKRHVAKAKVQGSSLKGKKKKVYKMLRKMGYSEQDALEEVEAGVARLRQR